MTVNPRRPDAKPAEAAPHEYIPDGPLEAAPFLGYCPPETRREAFAAVLGGVETGAYDRRMIAWLCAWDDTTARTIASLLWRCRQAAPVTARGSVVLTDAEAGIVRQALADAVAYRSEPAWCGDCAAAAPGKCDGHDGDAARAAACEALLRRLVTGEAAR